MSKGCWFKTATMNQLPWLSLDYMTSIFSSVTALKLSNISTDKSSTRWLGPVFSYRERGQASSMIPISSMC